MTLAKLTWAPSLEDADGPRYRAIADALEHDIASGKLQPGHRLPPHRNLAWEIGVTVGTVTRAYREAERRGLIAGEVGRGTYVLAPAARSSNAHRNWSMLEQGDLDGSDEINMGFDFPPPGVETEAAADILRELADDPGLAGFLAYQTHSGMLRHREAGLGWIGRRGFAPTLENVIVTSGAHNGTLISIAAAARPGDVILTEEVGYPGLKMVANMLGLTIKPVSIDGEGLVPEALEEAIERHTARMLYTIPTLHNPTNATQSPQRRAEIADILRRNELYAIEDDIYGHLPVNAPAPLASYAPDRVFYSTSISKSLAPGIRLGFLAIPEGMNATTLARARAINWMPSPLAAEIGARWILSDKCDRMLNAVRTEIEERRDLAVSILGLEGATAPPDGALHVWLHLPEQWNPTDFTLAASREGAILSSPEAFRFSRDTARDAVRISLGTPRTRERLRIGLERVKNLLESSPAESSGAVF